MFPVDRFRRALTDWLHDLFDGSLPDWLHDLFDEAIADWSDWFHGAQADRGLRKREAKILILGQDRARRTDLLDMLRKERFVQQLPAQINFNAFDLDDHRMAPRIYRDYAKFDAVVYLVAEFRLGASREELHALLADKSLVTVPFLVFVDRNNIALNINPFDRHFFFSDADVDEELEYMEGFLGLTDFIAGQGDVNLVGIKVRPLELFVCGIMHNMGYVEGFRWLSQYIK